MSAYGYTAMSPEEIERRRRVRLSVLGYALLALFIGIELVVFVKQGLIWNASHIDQILVFILISLITAGIFWVAEYMLFRGSVSKNPVSIGTVGNFLFGLGATLYFYKVFANGLITLILSLLLIIGKELLEYLFASAGIGKGGLIFRAIINRRKGDGSEIVGVIKHGTFNINGEPFDVYSPVYVEESPFEETPVNKTIDFAALLTGMILAMTLFL